MSEYAIRKTSFGLSENGQILLFEGCSRCGRSRLDHSPIKIPLTQWKHESDEAIPTMTRWYDFVCYRCARAVLAPWWDVLAFFYRRKYKMKRLKLEDIKCPKI